MINAKSDVACECGQCDESEACSWQGPRHETVVVEYMPRYLRSSHEAAGNSGSYPHNGAIRVRVERSCAERIIADSPEYAEMALPEAEWRRAITVTGRRGLQHMTDTLDEDPAVRGYWLLP